MPSRVANELIQSLDAPLQVRNQQFSASISIGIAVYPQDANTPANLHTNADHALYRAKEQGRNQYQCYSKCRSAIDDDTELERCLEYGLQENRFVLHYQPQVHADRVPCGVEALLRFQHPSRGLSSPQRVSATSPKRMVSCIGSESGLFRRPAASRGIGDPQGLPLLTMSVNVSAVQFSQHGLCRRRRAHPRRMRRCRRIYLELELTESLLLSNLEESVQTDGPA